MDRMSRMPLCISQIFKRHKGFVSSYFTKFIADRINVPISQYEPLICDKISSILTQSLN